MPSKLAQFCLFLHSFKEITWTRATLTICLAPFGLVLLIFVMLLLSAAKREGVVISNSLVCSSIGRKVLEEGGSAVDAAIATMLCEGLALPNSAGIGGGFTAVMYANGRFDSIVATPTAPSAVENISEFDESYTDGAKSVGVPGELMGYWEMHKKYGVLSWKRLFEPSIELCESGVPITEWLAGILRFHKARIVKSKTMGEVFDFAVTDNFIGEQKIRFLTLANTLRRIANEGVMAFYKGDIGDSFVKDLQEGDGIIAKKDLENYKVIWDDNPPTGFLKSNFKYVTTPLPTSGAITVFVLNIVKNLNIKNGPVFWHKVIEAMKHGFGRSALLGDAVNDPEFRESILKVYHEMLNEDFARKIRELIMDDKVFDNTSYYGSEYVPLPTNGSANICVLSPRGEAVSATTSILAEFGAYFASTSTGIITNNLLTRFIHHKLKQVKASPANRPLPGKHTFCPYSPTIVIRRKTAVPFFIVGASGGSKATTLVITALIKYVLNASTATGATSSRYLHNQLHPNRVEYEEPSDQKIMSYLQKVGHQMFQSYMTFENFTSVTSIGTRYDYLDAKFTNGVGGSVSLVHPKSDLNILLVILVGGLAASVVGLMLYEVLRPTHAVLIPPVRIESQHTRA